jgi:hypothetical protein
MNLVNVFKITDLGLTKKPASKSRVLMAITLAQTAFIDEILERFAMENSASVPTCNWTLISPAVPYLTQIKNAVSKQSDVCYI